ncbi:MAG: TIGR00266 family protein [Selenomonadaceae bacterium]|nr:TIGR00266 family protein [Selenomonadaceae bacterium]
MKYQILYPEAFPIVECELNRGERIKAESDAMIAMDDTIDVEGKMQGEGVGGILKGLARKFLAGESFFFQELIASRGAGKVLFAHSIPGGILDVELDGSYGLMVQKDGFLASTQDINVDTKMQNLSKGFLSGEGFFILHINGRGTVFLSSYGVIHPINIEAGREVVIDNGHLVAWPDYMEYNIEKASHGWISSFTSGEMLVCRFRGPGVVLIQTRNPGGFESWIKSFLPTSGGGGGGGSSFFGNDD